MNEAKEVVLFVNPKAGSGSGAASVEGAEDVLNNYGFRTTRVSLVEELGELVTRRRESIRAVVAAGGDGTAVTVAQHLRPGTPLAVLPLGTENLLARYLGYSGDAKQLAETIEGGSTRDIDSGLANGRMFLLMLSCGFDAEVVRRLHSEREGHITHLSYAMPIIESIRSYDYPNLRVSMTVDDKVETVDCHWAFVFNAPIYAGGLQIVSEADPTDGVFEVATFAGGSFWHGLWQFSAVILGQHHQLPDFQVRPAHKLRITSDEDDVPFQTDGDPGGKLPVEIELLPRSVTTLVPV